MDKSIKILCICQKGFTRAAGTRYRLTRRHFENVIAVGHQNTSTETLQMLVEWADVILIAETKMIALLREKGVDVAAKFEPRFNIGPDRWGKCFHPELQEIIKGQLNALGYR